MPFPAVGTASRPDRTFAIALGLVLAFAAAEILATAIHFASKYRAQHPITARPAIATQTAAPVSSPSGAASASVAPGQPAAISPTERLLKEAAGYRERGDTANALARLQEASQREPRNAQVLAELASIYESIQLYDRSNETWRKIEEIGPEAGQYYQLAENKLKVAAVAAAAPSGPPSDSAGKPLDAEGIPEGSVFGVTEISTEEVPDPDAETNFRLKIAIKSKAGTTIDHSKLRIMVLFYDLLDNDKVVPTDADVSYEWMNPKHDWTESNPELLIVSYLRSKSHAYTSEAALSAAAAAVTPGKGAPRTKKKTEPGGDASASDSHRKYLGYIIRIIYNDKLQTVRADPPRLLTDAPTSTP